MNFEYCDSCARETALLYKLVAAADVLVAKALVSSEVARIAKLELRLRQLLLRAWRLRTRQAAEIARETLNRGEGVQGIMRAIDAVMQKFAEDVVEPYTSGLAESYTLARQAAIDKANNPSGPSLQFTLAQLQRMSEPIQKVRRQPKNPVRRAKPRLRVKMTFDLFDESAVQALQDDQMIWIGKFYSVQLRAKIREAVREVVRTGGSRDVEAAALERAIGESFRNITIPSGFRGSDQDYFRMVAANAVTTARTRGQIRSFQDAGITIYELVNPMDFRTSKICRRLHGKQFRVEDALSQIDGQAGATTPEQYKAAAPWLTFGQLEKVSPKDGNQGLADSKALVDAGFILPPFHGLCRTTVDVVGFPEITGDPSGVSPGLAGTGGVGPPRVQRPAPTSRNVGRRETQPQPRNRGPTSGLPATLPFLFGLGVLLGDEDEGEQEDLDVTEE